MNKTLNPKKIIQMERSRGTQLAVADRSRLGYGPTSAGRRRVGQSVPGSLRFTERVIGF